MNRLLESARQVLFLSLALFFLSLTGLVVRAWFTPGPIEHATNRLLEKDGRLLVSIVSHPKMLSSLKTLLATKPLPPEKQPLTLALNSLLKKDGRLLVALTDSLLKQNSVRTLLKEATSATSSGTARSGKTSPLLENVANQALKQLFARDGKLLVSLTKTVMSQLPTNNQQKPSTPLLTPKALEGLIERLGQQVLTGLMKEDGKLVRSLLKDVLKSTAFNSGNKADNSAVLHSLIQAAERLSKGVIARLMKDEGKLARVLLKEVLKETAGTSTKRDNRANAKLTAQTLEKLGRYVTDRLLESRAKPIRSILEALIGPELMRLTREVRRTVQVIRKQTETLQLKGLVQAAAYSTSQGALETYLKQQAQAAQRKRQEAETLASLQSSLWEKVKKDASAQCFLPRDKAWLSLQGKVLNAQVRFIKGNVLQCPPMQCKLMLPLLAGKVSKVLQSSALSVDEVKLKVLPACP
jgi:hypothetical protein